MPEQPIGRDEFHAGLDSLRSEFNAGLNTAAVQVGAVERTLTADLDSKFSSLRLWGALALVSGQVLAGVVAGVVAPHGVGKPAALAFKAALGLIAG